MAKRIEIPYNGKKYTLEFTRTTAASLEKDGFIADKLAENPAIMIPKLVRCAFLANHPNTKVATIDKIYDSLNKKTSLVGILRGMYLETVYSLLSSDEGEEDEGNPGWEAVE